jgi:DNA-binding transcriptional regulator YhcF (GntR family)
VVEALRARALDIGRQASSADLVYRALRDAIIRGEIREGEALRQESIAQMFNVSRIPVREAMQRLEAQGLVISARFKGVVVASLSADQIKEIFEFRALLEPAVIAMAVPMMPERTLEEAQGFCDDFASKPIRHAGATLTANFTPASTATARSRISCQSSERRAISWSDMSGWFSTSLRACAARWWNTRQYLTPAKRATRISQPC